MTARTVGFCCLLLCGALSIQLCSRLPPDGSLSLLLLLTAGCLLVRPARPVGAFLLGFTLISVSARDVVGSKLRPDLAGKDVESGFRVTEFAAEKNNPTRFVVAPLDVALGLPPTIRLTWYDATATPQIGECWTLSVRLRRPRGFSNPHGFDYEGWLFRQKIGATGYVRGGERLVSCAPPPPMTRLRRHFTARMSAVLPDDDATAVLLAITTGARHRISAEQWQRYAITGTSHLMAISGLHIGLVAGGGFVLGWCLLAGLGRTGNLCDQAALIGFALAAGYALLSGFAVPSRRALVMIGLALVATLARRQFPASRLLAITCIGVALADPLAVLTPGFQLSFAAVAILLWLAGHRARGGAIEDSRLRARLARGLRGLVTLQFALLAGLLPLTALWFDRMAWTAPGVNLAVLPVFNLVTVPAALIGLVMAGPLAPAGDALLRIAWHSVTFMQRLIDLAAGLPGADLRVADAGGIALAATWLAVLWVMLPRSWPGRRIGWLAVLLTALHVPARPPAGCIDLATLDVGQGLAVVMRTARHTLVFDAGPSFRSGGDTGALVVSPYLQGLGSPPVDLLVVSHADSDHAGGVPSLMAGNRVTAVLAGESLPGLSPRSLPCQRGQFWRWDDVSFTVLHPPGGGSPEGNNASCVIEVRAGRYTAILSGDIELAAERALLRDGQLEAADLVVVPHHGSRTSSHQAFVDRLQPAVAIVPAGFGNRWGFPHADVVGRWREAGAEVVVTAHAGAATYRVCAANGLQRLGLHRIDTRRVWHEVDD